MRSDTLFLIPARAGSKGIPGKNHRPLAGRPLIDYSIQFARQFAGPDDIIVSTDSQIIMDLAIKAGLENRPLRKKTLSTDNTPMSAVVINELEQLSGQSQYTYLCLLQPTSPLRETSSLSKAFNIMNDEVDLVVGVSEVESNPLYLLKKEEANGHLSNYSDVTYDRRQDAPTLYQLNGALYLFRISSLLDKGWVSDFDMVRKVVMSRRESIDLDTEDDWLYCEYIMSRS